MDKASVEQRALINKLADEYADELNNLGVRVSALENRVGNVKLTGDARIRYINQGGDDQKSEVHYTKDGEIKLRLQIIKLKMMILGLIVSAFVPMLRSTTVRKSSMVLAPTM